MAAVLVQSKSAAQNTGLATVAASWNSAATGGNLLLIMVAADDYAASPPTGFTQSTGCGQQTFLGHYLWWKVAAGGETSANYTIGSASPSCWCTAEYSGLTSTPYDISAGQLNTTFGTTYTTPSLTPSAGDRLLIASMGGSDDASVDAGLSTWTNSFTEITQAHTTLASGTRDIGGIAAFTVTANGSTPYSSGATYPTGMDSHTGIIAAFKVATAAAAPVAKRRLVNQAVRRSAIY